VVNALSFAAAATLLARWRPAPAAPSPETETAKTGTSGGAAGAAGAAAGAAKVGYRTVLRDARYMLLVGINVSFVFASLLNSLLLAVYITEGLHRQAWLAGVLAVMNTAQVALTQSLVSRRLERFRPMKVIATACALDTLAFLIFASLYSVPGWAVFVGRPWASAPSPRSPRPRTPPTSVWRWPPSTCAAATWGSTSSPTRWRRPSPRRC
jgi:hypothetical protein